MIDEIPVGGTEIKFPGPFGVPEKTPQKHEPFDDYIWLDYKKPTMVGNLHLPDSVKGLELIIVPVLEVGPSCKQAKAGSKVLLMANAIMGGETGAMLNGQRIYFTRERHIVSVVT